LAGVVFSTLASAQAQLAPGADVMSAPPDALVAGVAGVYRLFSLVFGASMVLAAFALWFDSHHAPAPEAAPASD